MTDHPPSPDALRAAFGRFPTGVTLVTVAGPEGPLGMTANSFTSVSLEPPLLLWCPARRSARHEAMVSAPRFALHVLARDQEDLARAFARSADAFDEARWAPDAEGLPLIEGAAARFICRRHSATEAGDHSIVVGEIESIETQDKPALVFHRGLYGGHAPGTG